MIISIIAAVSENNVIGKNNQLIWHLPADMKFFKETTAGHHVLMGEKNYLSIPDKYRPLPERINIVATHQPDFEAEGCVVVHSIEDGIEYARNNGEEEVFIIGGGEIYKQTLGLADKMYITWVHKSFEGDTFFPEFDINDWGEISSTPFQRDDRHECAFTIKVYEKKKTDV